MQNMLDSCLDEVFVVKRKPNLVYNRMPKEILIELKNIFTLNPYPSKDQYIKYSIDFNISEKKIKDWFKYQRLKDFKQEKSIIKTRKNKKRFSIKEEKILISYFYKSANLSEKLLEELKEKLNCSSKKIRDWFAYRNKKMMKILKDKYCLSDEFTERSFSELSEEEKNEEIIESKSEIDRNKIIYQENYNNNLFFSKNNLNMCEFSNKYYYGGYNITQPMIYYSYALNQRPMYFF